MIFELQYGGHQEVTKDGQKIRLPIPPPIALQNFGAVIPVTITHPKVIASAMQKEGKPIPAKNITALLDTGAFGCVILPEIAQELGLKQTGFQKVTSVQDEQERPAYFARIQFQWGKGKDIQVVACPLKSNQYQCLIGRDILLHWQLIYSGQMGRITICD